MHLYQYTAQPNKEELQVSDALLRLSKNLLSTQTDLLKEQVLVRLLVSINGRYFGEKFPPNKSHDYESILKVLVDYYNDERREMVRKIFMVKMACSEKFVHVFQLVLDLALETSEEHNSRFISEILQMNEEDKQILMTYIKEVTNRAFIGRLLDPQDDLLSFKTQEYQELQEHFEELKRNFLELNDNYNNLKAHNEKLHQDNSQLIHERDEFMVELGVHSSLSYIEIAEKYKKDMKECELYVERLSKELEEKSQLLKQKEEEVVRMSSTLSKQDVEQDEKHEVLHKNRELQELLLAALEKENSYILEAQKHTQKIQKLSQALEQSEAKIRALERTRDKYQEVRSTHAGFKRTFLQRMGNMNRAA